MHDKDYAASPSELWAATNAALECLEWTEHNEESNDLDGFYFDDESKALIHEELSHFITENSEDLHGLEYSQIGHDFILTRNGHGAGFWDRGLGEAGERLTAATKLYGSITAFELNGALRAEAC